MSFDDLFTAMKESASASSWSRGVDLSRRADFFEETATAEEIVLRVRVADKTVTPRVKLWLQDEDWSCDCGEKEDPCAHAVASIILLKNGTKLNAAASFETEAAYVVYRFNDNPGGLGLQRFISFRGQETPLPESLTAYSGGIQSGRLEGPHVAANQSEFRVDTILGRYVRGPLSTEVVLLLFREMQEFERIFWNDTSIRVSPKAVAWEAELHEANGGLELRRVPPAGTKKMFANGVVLVDSVLRPLTPLALNPQERELLKPEGFFIPKESIADFRSRILPVLENKLRVRKSSELGDAKIMPPRIELQTDTLDDGSLVVVPRLLYGDPPIAEIRDGRLTSFGASDVPLRDIAAEQGLARQLQQELNLRPGQPARYSGNDAVEWLTRIRRWMVTGRGKEIFTAKETLKPRIESGSGGPVLTFGSGAGHASPQAVFRAWRENTLHVPLVEGGWARIPSDWLQKFGEKLERFFAAKEPAASALIQNLAAADLALETGIETVESLTSIRKRISESPAEQNAAPVLNADLRPYQTEGIQWLLRLRSMGVGALLADDMGLGKTLQTIAVLEKPSVVVAPTSVLQSWLDQIAAFRPSLKVCLYHGPNRKFDETADVILTSYALLRQDEVRLTEKKWKTAVLDEAQYIKNPESMTARIAFGLESEFRVALSGTPVENRLEDLWSLFRFLNPGLLGSLSWFKENYSLPVSRGETKALDEVRRRVRPFLLRRLKSQVARDLPPRTDAVRHCELQDDERTLYDSILNSSRRQVLDLLEEGSVIQALEMLLRLRQACCHPSLLPGQQAPTSSKTELLLELLQESRAEGHRSLVFSQWTSYLDLIEPHLKAKNFRYGRLDGSTRDRPGVVADFQRPEGPDLLLLSIKAGGVGLTLTAADHIYILDPWWNPTVEQQAADRAHRIGQTNPVFVQRLIAKNTLEERILELQERKRGLAGALLEDAGSASGLTRADILHLLS